MDPSLQTLSKLIDENIISSRIEGKIKIFWKADHFNLAENLDRGAGAPAPRLMRARSQANDPLIRPLGDHAWGRHYL